MFRKMFLFALCGYVGLASAEPTVSTDKLSGIDEIVNKALDTFKVPGCAIGVVVKDKVVLLKGYGVRDKERNLPVTENTVFAIGSCTKAFTTFALGQLVDEGVIGWDDPVIQHIPEFRLKDPHATLKLTIRDLVTHRSGLPRHDLVWYGSDFSRKDLLSRLQYLELSSDIREKFQYNNLMYGVAGILIEKLTGQTWEEAIRDRILSPLGMTQSNFSVLDSQESPDFSLPYRESDGNVERVPFRKITNVGPAGSINSSVADMVKWIQLQLSSGPFAAKPLIQKTTLQEMHTLQMPIPSYPTEPIYMYGYGLGWCIGVHKGHYSVSHRGGIDGFASNVAMLPKEEIGLVVLTNSSSDGHYFITAVTNAILDRLIDAKEIDWIAKGSAEQALIQEATQKKKKEASEKGSCLSPFEQYVGDYEHPAYGRMKIYLKDEVLMGEYNHLEFKLQHTNYDAFTAAVQSLILPLEHFPFQFLRSSSGDISEVHVPFEVSVEPIVFKKVASNDLLALDYLKRYVGIFDGAGISLEVQLKGNQLSMIVPGQPSVDLIATKQNLFALKGASGSDAEFVTDANGVVTEMTLTTPYGKISFKAIAIK